MTFLFEPLEGTRDEENEEYECILTSNLQEEKKKWISIANESEFGENREKKYVCWWLCVAARAGIYRTATFTTTAACYYALFVRWVVTIVTRNSINCPHNQTTIKPKHIWNLFLIAVLDKGEERWKKGDKNIPPTKQFRSMECVKKCGRSTTCIHTHALSHTLNNTNRTRSFLYNKSAITWVLWNALFPCPDTCAQPYTTQSMAC